MQILKKLTKTFVIKLQKKKKNDKKLKKYLCFELIYAKQILQFILF